ncbi:hypothetical protein MBLNU457_4088t1 [Dothideomycetes sp. NU457]
MVKFYSTSYSYDYSFPAVSLAYFLRYPNPYSTHVLSTDVIDRHFDPETQRMTTVRLHLKRSKLPTAVVKLLPKSILGSSSDGNSTSYILERSTIDIKEGWMKTENKNMDWTAVLSVIESQEYRRPGGALTGESHNSLQQGAQETTNVTTTVALRSHIGENIRKRRARRAEAAASDSDDQPSMGFFKSWTTGSIQRSIELIGLRRAEGAQPKAKEGMRVVLERLRDGGLVGVLEGMRRDRELVFANQGDWKVRSDQSASLSEPDIEWRDD